MPCCMDWCLPFCVWCVFPDCLCEILYAEFMVCDKSALITDCQAKLVYEIYLIYLICPPRYILHLLKH